MEGTKVKVIRTWLSNYYNPEYVAGYGDIVYDVDYMFIVEHNPGYGEQVPEQIQNEHTNHNLLFNLPVEVHNVATWVEQAISVEYIYSILNRPEISNLLSNILSSNDICKSIIPSLKYSALDSEFMSDDEKENRFYSFDGEEKTPNNFGFIELFSVIIRESLLRGAVNIMTTGLGSTKTSKRKQSVTIETMLNLILSYLYKGVLEIITLKFIKELYDNCYIEADVETIGFLMQGTHGVSQVNPEFYNSTIACDLGKNEIYKALYDLFMENAKRMNQEIITIKENCPFVVA